MINTQQITCQMLIPKFTATYQGSSTQQINQSYIYLLNAGKNQSNSFINACQKILQTSSTNKYLCQSICNFIKVLTKIMTDQGFINEFGPKDYINKIQHIFDNSKILVQFKENIALSYIKAALHFKLNLQKIIGRIAYLYKTNDSYHGVLLSRAYLSCDSRIDAKSQSFYYNKIMPLQFKYLYDEIISFKKLISEGNQNDFEKAQNKMKNIQQVLKNLHSALVFIAFEKFETSIFTCLQKQQIIEIINSMEILAQNFQTMIILRQIIQKVVQSLFRMRRMQKIPNLMKALSYQLHKEWKIFNQSLLNRNSLIYKGFYSQQRDFELQNQISKIKLLTAALNSKIILILDEDFDILNLIVQPLFEIRTQIFQKSQQDIKQVFLLFEDACFFMKSECFEVQFNRMIKSLLNSYQIISSKILFTLDELLFNNGSFQQLLQKNQNTVVMLMSLLAFQSSYFMTNDGVIHKVQAFILRHESLLFNKQNIQLYFHSLLILCNFLDDIFCENFDTKIFQNISQNFIENRINMKNGMLNNNQMNLITYFERSILKQFYSVGFAQKQIQKESLLLIAYLSQNFDEQGIIIFIQIIKNYKIEDKVTLQVLDKVLSQISEIISKNQNNFSHITIYSFMKLLQTFFDLDMYKHLFESTMSRILPIFKVLISNANQYIEEFFNLIKNAITHLEYVPENYLSWMVYLFNSKMLQSQQSFKSLISVLKYVTPSKQINSLNYQIFVNCIALNLLQIIVKSNIVEDINTQEGLINAFSQINMSQQSNEKSHQQKSYFSQKNQDNYSKKQLLSLLCLHQLIYYHCNYFTHKILKQIISLSASKIIFYNQQRQSKDQRSQKKCNSFSFVRGKYQLNFILLFKRRLIDVNQILFQLGLQKKVYDTVYMRDTQYLIEYDTPILIKQQIQILKKFMTQDKMQITYANTSFLTIFYKFYILFEIKNTQNRKKLEYIDFESEDSDEQDFQSDTDFKKNFKQVIKLVNSFPKPQQWTQINELQQIKNFIKMLRSNQSTREWLDLLIKNCLNKDQTNLMQDLTKDLQNVNGKYRHILKIKNPEKSAQKSKHNNAHI